MKTPRNTARRRGMSSRKESQHSDSKPAGTHSKSASLSHKPWGGRFAEPTHASVEQFTSSLTFDRRLFEQDIRGSIAHAKTLERARVLTRKDCRVIIQGLEQVCVEIRKGTFPFSSRDEDIHMAIERRLTQLIGPVGGKIHTGRSRNDQVALDIRLYLRDTLQGVTERIADLQRSLIAQARTHIDVILPGYTHLQRAQPVLLAHHLLAYVEMLERDRSRLRDVLNRVNVMPLGSGALAGANYPLDRLYTAKLLAFPAVSQNSLDAVSDRDFVIETLAALAILMMHLSRLSEELILWSSQEFQFVELPDGYCTGSSMMPQKKNPDIPELVRGKTGRVYGDLLAVLTTLKGLPLSYNRDLQEDKEPLFDALDTVLSSVEIYAALVSALKFDPVAMAMSAGTGYLLATELADYLVKKGVPFREAHGIVGRLVKSCLTSGRQLRDLRLADLQESSAHFGPDAISMLNLKSAIDRKNLIGGTATGQVEKQLRAWEKSLAIPGKSSRTARQGR